MPRPAAFLMLVAAMAMVGANVPIGKSVVTVVPVALFLEFRFLVSSLALALLLPMADGRRLAALSPSEWARIGLMALVGMVGFSWFMLEGVKRTAAIDAGILTATLPAVVTALGVLTFRERLGSARLIAILLAVAGVALIATAGAEAGPRTLAGNLLIGAAVVCEALFVMLAKSLARDLSPIRLALAANLIGLVLSVPLAVPALRTFEFAAVSAPLWVLALWYVLAASVFSLLFWYKALPHVETSLAGLATAALPLSALAVSVLGLGERLSWSQGIGAVLVLTAILFGARTQPRPSHA